MPYRDDVLHDGHRSNQLNLRGSYMTWFGSVAAKTMAVESGVPHDGAVLRRHVEDVVSRRHAAAAWHHLQDDERLARNVLAQMLDEGAGIEAPGGTVGHRQIVRDGLCRDRNLQPIAPAQQE